MVMWALAFLVYSAQDASALQRANIQDYHDIQDQIRNKKAAEDEIVTQNAELLKAGEDEAEKRKINLKISLLKKVQKNAADQALWLTARAYDIIPFADNVPILDEGTSVLLSPEKGNTLTWLPVFEDNGKKELQNERGRSAGSRIVGPGTAGNTASDGISRVFPAAFSSPEMLASIIIHEQRHFTQNTTDGEGNKKTTAELEVEAYEEEWRLMDALGFSGDSKLSQKKRLTEILDGKKGVKGQKDIIGKRKLAADERAEANKINGGWPPPEPSIVSHSTVEIADLIKQAKEQILIAQLDHDNRLRNTMKELIQRSCDNPGSVSRAELLALPKPHKKYFWTTNGPERCYEAYSYIAQGGVDAEELRRQSTPILGALPIPPDPPTATPAPPQPAHAVPASPPPFSRVLPFLKEFAVEACLAPEQVPMDDSIYMTYDCSSTGHDGNLARQLSSDLENCPRQIFNQLISTIRAGQGLTINRQWVRTNVAANTPGPGITPGYGNPPQGGGGRGCERNGDPFGCQPRHP